MIPADEDSPSTSTAASEETTAGLLAETKTASPEERFPLPQGRRRSREEHRDRHSRFPSITFLENLASSFYEAFQEVLRRAFFRVGFSIGTFPWIFIAVTLLFSVLSVGLPRLRFEQRFKEGFIEKNAPSTREKAIFAEFGRNRGNTAWFLVMIREKDRSSLLELDRIREVLEVHKYLSHELSVEYEGRRFTHAEICGEMCDINKALYAFEDCLVQLKSPGNQTNCFVDHPQSIYMNHRLPIAHHLYDISRATEEALQEEEDRETEQLLKAYSSADIGFELLGRPSRAAFQRSNLSAVGLVMLIFDAPLPDDRAVNIVSMWEEAVFHWSDNQTRFPNFTIDVLGDKILGKEMVAGGLAILPYVGYGFGAIVVFVSLCILIPAHRERRWSFGLIYIILGIITPPLLAATSTFGLLGLCDIAIYPPLMVIPVLILGIGVDNAFLLEHTWRRVRRERLFYKEDLASTLALVFEDFGPSILITSSTNALAFGIGAVFATPAIRLFCLATTVTVVVAFVLQLTLFGAVLVMAGRMDTLPEKPLALLPPPKRSKALQMYSKFISAHPVQIIVLFLSLASFAYTTWAALQMETAIETSKIIPRQSRLQQSDELLSLYMFKEYEPVEVLVSKPPVLNNKTEMEEFYKMLHDFESLTRCIGHSATVMFLEDYIRFYKAFYGVLELLAPNSNIDYSDIPFFLNWTGAGQVYRDMMKGHIDERGHWTMDAFSFMLGFHNASSWMERANNMIEWRAVAAKYEHFNVTVYTDVAPVFEGIFMLKRTTHMTAACTLFAMLIVCFLLIPSKAGVIIAGAAVCSISMGVLGGLSLLGHRLDPVSMAAVLMAIGMSVDYTAHVVYHYQRMHSVLPRKSRRDRYVYETISSVGWPMMQAALSSLLCFFPVIFQEDYTPQVFVRTIILVVVNSLIHGLVVLPAILSLLPASCFEDKKQRVQNMIHHTPLPLVIEKVETTREGDEAGSDSTSNSNSTTESLLLKEEEAKCQLA